MTERKFLKKIQKSLAVLCLAGVVALAPVSSANARSYHHGDTLVAAAIGGAVAGLVGGVVQGVMNPNSTVVVEHPTYVVERPAYIIEEPVVIHRPRKYYAPVRYIRHYHRYY